MSITVTEKEHWRKRLAARIERRIDALVAATQPGFLLQVEDSTKTKAQSALGIEQELIAAKELESKAETASKKAKELKAKAFAKAKRRATSTVGYQYHTDHALTALVESEAKHYRTAIMEETELGRQILRLEQEKEELLDTIWLATSPKQIKELWTALGELLEATPTNLQANALKSEPAG